MSLNNSGLEINKKQNKKRTNKCSKTLLIIVRKIQILTGHSKILINLYALEKQ